MSDDLEEGNRHSTVWPSVPKLSWRVCITSSELSWPCKVSSRSRYPFANLPCSSYFSVRNCDKPFSSKDIFQRLKEVVLRGLLYRENSRYDELSVSEFHSIYRLPILTVSLIPASYGEDSVRSQYRCFRPSRYRDSVFVCVCIQRQQQNCTCQCTERNLHRTAPRLISTCELLGLGTLMKSEFPCTRRLPTSSADFHEYVNTSWANSCLHR